MLSQGFVFPGVSVHTIQTPTGPCLQTGTSQVFLSPFQNSSCFNRSLICRAQTLFAGCSILDNFKDEIFNLA